MLGSKRFWITAYAAIWMVMLFLWLGVAFNLSSSPLTWVWAGPLPYLPVPFFTLASLLPLLSLIVLFLLKHRLVESAQTRYFRITWLVWFIFLFLPYLSESRSSFDYQDRSSRVLQYVTHMLLWSAAVYYLLPRIYHYRHTRFLFVAASIILQAFNRLSLRRCVVLACVMAFTILIWISHSWFGFTPFANDSVVQYVHARLMAAGHISWEVEPFFKPIGWGIYQDGKWYSQFMPVHMALQAIGHLVGTPWLINPVLSIISLCLLSYLTKLMYGASAARLAPFLYFGSLYMLVISASMMNHPTGLLGTLLCILGVYQTVQHNKARWAAIAVLGMWMLAGSRAVNAPGLLAAMILWGGYYMLPQWRYYQRTITIGLILGVIALLSMLGYNEITTGHIFKTPYLMVQQDFFGRMLQISTIRPFGPPIHYMSRLQDISIRLFDWPIPSLIFMAWLCIRYPKSKENNLLLLALLLPPISYISAYDRLFLPRYLFEGAGSSLLILSAAGMVDFARWLKTRPQLRSVPVMHVSAGIFLIIISLYAASWQRSYNLRMQKYANYYWEGYPAAISTLEATIKKPALIYVTNDYRFLWAMPSYPPKPEDDIIYARWQKGSKDEADYLARYPERHIYYTNFLYTSLLRKPVAP
jgi:hypothetical protein